MSTEFSAQEKELLVELLRTELGDVRQEIHHTKTHEYRDKLKLREVMARELIEKLTGESVQL